MTIINIGTVIDMNPGCIRTNVRQSWGITRTDGSKLLFVWDHELEKDEQGLWANLYAPDTDGTRYGGRERLSHVRAIEAGTIGHALIGFNQPDPDGSNHWYGFRGEPEYRITTTRVDSNGVIWGKLERVEIPPPPPPYRRNYRVRP